MRSPLWPLLAAALFTTGCGMQTKIEYESSAKSKTTESRQPIGEEKDQGGSRTEASRTRFRLEVDGHTQTAPQAKQPVEMIVPPSTVEVPTSAPITVQAQTINIHVGDVHNHTHSHIHITQIHAPQQIVTTPVVVREPTPRSSQPPVPVMDARCRRLRQQYEAREAEWNKLFKQQ